MRQAQIGRRIRAEREARGWTQEELIRRLEKRGQTMVASTLSRIESGQIRSFHEELLAALERVFGIGDIRSGATAEVRE